MQVPNRKAIKFTHTSDGYKYNPNVFAPGAKCPNHGCRLYMTDQKGIGICEISGVYFDYEEGPEQTEGKNRNREFSIQIINGKPQKVFRVAPGFKRDLTRK